MIFLIVNFNELKEIPAKRETREEIKNQSDMQCVPTFNSTYRQRFMPIPLQFERNLYFAESRALEKQVIMMKLCSGSVRDDVIHQISHLDLSFTFHLSHSIVTWWLAWRCAPFVLQMCLDKQSQCKDLAHTLNRQCFPFNFLKSRTAEWERKKRKCDQCWDTQERNNKKYQKKPVSSEWRKTELND